MGKITSVCVYCASREGKDPALKASAIRLGELLAEHNIKLIYGGSKIGLMGTMADTVLKNNGYVIGIIPDVLVKSEQAHTSLNEQYIVRSMHERKSLMAEKADAFIVLPGGFGTMDETFEIITWKYIGLHNKPVVLVNINGFYDPFTALIEHFTRHGVVTEEHTRHYTLANTVEEALEDAQKQAEATGFTDTARL